MLIICDHANKCQSFRIMKLYSVAVGLLVVLCLVGAGGAINIDEELRITYEQKLAIDKLRQRVGAHLTEPYMKEDLHLLRWLRATKFNIDEAQKRLMENIKWRKQNKIATIHKEDFSEIAEDYPYVFTVDKQGQPAFIAFAGEWDIRNAVLTGRAARIIRYMNKALESGARVIRQMQYAGKNITRLNLIIDLDGFNIAQHGCLNCLFRILDFLLLYDNHYPGLADKVIFINTPPSVAAAAEIVRNNANSETMKAIKLYGTNKKVWQKILLDFIDRDELPTELGGTKKRAAMTRELQI